MDGSSEVIRAVILVSSDGVGAGSMSAVLLVYGGGGREVHGIRTRERVVGGNY